MKLIRLSLFWAVIFGGGAALLGLPGHIVAAGALLGVTVAVYSEWNHDGD